MCSYDPNDKRLFPKQCFYEESDSLEFIVRFQNTGNYPAETVRLIDTLDLEKLDIMSFKVMGASHDYTWSFKEPSILEVVFDDIRFHAQTNDKIIKPIMRIDFHYVPQNGSIPDWNHRFGYSFIFSFKPCTPTSCQDYNFHIDKPNFKIIANNIVEKS